MAGPQTVELTVGEEVTAVELLLDGWQVAVVQGPPWKAELDLGTELAPHHLVAVARDAEGIETASTEQWINLPQPRSQVELLPESASSGPPRHVRVLWQSVDGARPDSGRITFDGEPVTITDLGRVELPDYDPGQTHLLTVELRFGYSLAHAEIIIGGTAGEAIGSELTAFPVEVAGGRKAPGAAEMTGWFRRAGRPLRVVAVDQGPADMIVVQDQSARVAAQLDRLRRDLALEPHAVISEKPGATGVNAGDRLRVIVPYALPVATAQPASPADGETPRELFPISGDLAVEDRTPTSVGVGRRLVAGARHTGLLAAIFYRAPPAEAPHRLAEAVAEAGRAAAAGGRPRMVLLVTGPESPDHSRFSPTEVRAYLRRLQVPLVVWSPRAPAGWSAWGGAVDRIRGGSQLIHALRQVRVRLDRQLVVWLEGRHLPQEIELTAAAARWLRPVVETVPPERVAGPASP